MRSNNKCGYLSVTGIPSAKGYENCIILQNLDFSVGITLDFSWHRTNISMTSDIIHVIDPQYKFSCLSETFFNSVEFYCHWLIWSTILFHITVYSHFSLYFSFILQPLAV